MISITSMPIGASLIPNSWEAVNSVSTMLYDNSLLVAMETC